MRVISVLSLKGGVGKTTFVSHLTAPLVGLLRTLHGPEARLLVIDADTQCGATATLGGLDTRALEATVATVLTGQHTLLEAVIDLDDPDGPIHEDLAAARSGVSLLPSTELSRVRVADQAGFEILRELLGEPDALPEHVELVLIDCGYGDTDLTELAMVAADDIIAVVVPNAMDAHGLNLLMRKIQRMSTRFPHLRLSGVVVNRYARSDVADEEVLNDLTDQLGARLLTPVVPDSAAIKRANNQGLPIAHYHPLQPGLIAVFAALARQVLPEASRAGGRHRHTKEDT